ncbi:MAG: uracil-DNA glycosylase [Spirochaetales bacterium]
MMDTEHLFNQYNEILLDYQDLLYSPFRDPRRNPSPVIGFLDAPLFQESMEEREEMLKRLERTILQCERCRLSRGRTHAVPGMGVLDPLVMVIGEGPGAEEDRQGFPFVGAAGQFLAKWLAAVGLSREKNAYIANVVKCRPPGNRDPQGDEVAACFPYLVKQVELIRPRTILAVGRIAAQCLLQTNRGIGSLRGTVHRWKDIPLVATYHPSAVLRDMNLKRPVWEDLKRLKAILDSFPPTRSK